MRAEIAPSVDGDPSDAAWSVAEWHAIDHLYLGDMPEPNDFSGRYKLLWTPEYLYILAEIVDDVLIDAHPHPLEQYWEDDAFEILVDEDASGGNHQFDYNAFAYHISLDNQIVDIAPYANSDDHRNKKTNVRTFPDHVTAKWMRSRNFPHKIYWEARVSIYNENYSDVNSSDLGSDSAITLTSGKTMGLLIAYCDADDASGRQHFLGDVEIEPVNGSRNRAYIDADVFGQITLVDSNNRNREK